MIPPRRLLPAALLTALLAAVVSVALSAVLSTSAAATASASAAVSGSAARPGDCAPLDGSDKTALLEAAASKDVFIGQVVTIGPAGATGSMTYDVLVKDVLRGTVVAGTRVAVTINWMSTSPQQSVTKTNYLFLASPGGQGLDADRCRGTIEIRDKGAAKRIKTWKKWFANHPDGAPTDTPASTTPEVTFSQPDPPLGEPQRLSRVVAPGAALALVGVLGLLLTTRLGRHR